MSKKKNNKIPIQKSETPIITVENPVIKSNNNEALTHYKEEIIRWILTIGCSLAVYILVALLIKFFYKPNIDILLEEAKKQLINYGSALPEPMESLLFRTGVIVILLSMLGFYKLFSNHKLVKKLAEQQLFIIISALIIAFIALLFWVDFKTGNPFYSTNGRLIQNSRDFTAKTNFDFYFEGFFLGKNLLFYVFAIVPILSAIFFVGIKRYNWEHNKVYNNVVTVLGYMALAYVVWVCVAMSIFYFPYAYENKYNFNAVYYSVTQVYAGLPLLIDGFTSTYGLYPYFLNIIFHFTGLSVLNFSLILGVLLGVSFLANFYSLKLYVSNKLILFLGILTVIFFPFLDFKFGQNFDCNFAFYPIRYIIPSILILLTSIYLKKRSTIIYWATCIVSAIFILWNPEFGMVCHISWLLFNTYNDFYTKEKKINWKQIAFHWVVNILIVFIVFYLFKLIIYLIYGTAPALSLLFNTILVFGKIGANLLPMKLVHPWNIIALILVIGFAYSIIKWIKKEINNKIALIFLVSVLGLGFFTYFQGRSHNWQLAQSSSMSLIVLTLLGSDLWETIKKYNIFIFNGLFVVFLFVISFSVFEIFYNTDRINELVSQEIDKTNQQAEQQRIENNADFILKNTSEGQKIYVFTAMQHLGLYFNGNKRKSAFNPGLGDLFLNSDLLKMEKQIKDSAYTAFIEPTTCNYFYMARPFAAFGAGYEVSKVNKTLVMLTKRKMAIPRETYFRQEANLVIHRKYNDDTLAIRMRIDDAMGIKPVMLNPEFSVEVLFYSDTQMCQYATLLGNMNDTSGFIMANIINTSNYFFGTNGKGGSFQLPNKQWVYCVMNVYPDHLEVYQNGNLAGSIPISAPMKQSPENLYIGNLGFLRNYVGAISEVAIYNKAMDKNQIQEVWNEIKKQ